MIKSYGSISPKYVLIFPKYFHDFVLSTTKKLDIESENIVDNRNSQINHYCGTL